MDGSMIIIDPNTYRLRQGFRPMGVSLSGAWLGHDLRVLSSYGGREPGKAWVLTQVLSLLTLMPITRFSQAR